MNNGGIGNPSPARNPNRRGCSARRAARVKGAMADGRAVLTRRGREPDVKTQDCNGENGDDDKVFRVAEKLDAYKHTTVTYVRGCQDGSELRYPRQPAP